VRAKSGGTLPSVPELCGTLSVLRRAPSDEKSVGKLLSPSHF